jgi:pimeloyl-ACP methyl ester carboxylesterase
LEGAVILATFVIVHGAFGGGWEWAAVAGALRALEHNVFTLTLTGMGERHHLGPELGLTTHIEDVVAVLEFEDLHDVVMCGASYGGMAVTGAADRVPERIALVVYIDALVPQNGQSGLNLLPPAFGKMVRDAADARGHGWVAIPPGILPPEGLIPDEARAKYIARLRNQPIGTFTEPIRLTGSVDRLPRAFIRCTGGVLEGDPIAPMATRARSEGWIYRELATPHDPQLFNPTGTAAMLDELDSALAVAKSLTLQLP